MFDSGRGVWNRKKRVDEVRSIDILDLQRNKVFSRGSNMRWTASWSWNGKVVASVSYQLEGSIGEPSGLRFTYSITDNNPDRMKAYNYIIPVVSTRCNFGGKRWWYICPLIVNGDSCLRRCRILYLPPGTEYFGCRECHQLSYESKQRHREKFYEKYEKPFKTIMAINDKLGRTRSWEKKVAMSHKLLQAAQKINNYTDLITNQKPMNL